jgi:hypothetical protein
MVFLTVCEVQKIRKQSVVVVVSVDVTQPALAANGMVESKPRLRTPIPISSEATEHSILGI